MVRAGRPISFNPQSTRPTTESDAMYVWGYEAMARIKRGMAELGWGYKELADALRSQGIKRATATINRRINRGNFSAGFFLACLYVLENSTETKTENSPESGPCPPSIKTRV